MFRFTLFVDALYIVILFILTWRSEIEDRLSDIPDTSGTASEGNKKFMLEYGSAKVVFEIPALEFVI